MKGLIWKRLSFDFILHLKLTKAAEMITVKLSQRDLYSKRTKEQERWKVANYLLKLIQNLQIGSAKFVVWFDIKISNICFWITKCISGAGAFERVLVQNVNKTKSYEIENDNDNNQNDSHDKILNKKPAGCLRGEQ